MRFVGTAVLLGWMLLATQSYAQLSTTSPPSNKDKDDEPTSVGGKKLAEWKAELKHADAYKRARAILAIMQFGNSAASCVPDILARLDDGDVSPRARALLALRTIAVEEKMVPDIVRAVSRRLSPTIESQAIIRYEALITLYRYIPDGVPAVPDLINATRDRASWEIRHNSIALLWRIGVDTMKDGQPDNRITEALLQSLWLKGATYQERLETIQGLGALGRPNHPSLLNRVVADLTACTNTTNEQNRPLTIWAYAGLVTMQDGAAAEKAFLRLNDFLKYKDIEMRVQATIAIGAIKSKNPKRIPAILGMLKDKEPFVVMAACTSLGMAGEKSDAVIDALLETLKHKDTGVAANAVSALVGLKQNNKRVLDAFDKMRENKELDIRLRAGIEAAIEELKKPAKKEK